MCHLSVTEDVSISKRVVDYHPTMGFIICTDQEEGEILNR